MCWNFALINNRLAEIYFDENKNGKFKIWGHCHVNKSEFKTKKEQEWIRKDTEKLQYTYYKKKYRMKTIN